jgi:uncharacterized protein
VSLLVLPIFPLPDIAFFPHTLLPLHVFEPRYRAMVTDTIGRRGRLAVVALKAGYEANYAGKPGVHAVAGAGPIVSAEKLATGRYNIVVRGECRIRILGEIPTDTLYRVVRAEQLADVAPERDVGAVLERIRSACRRLLVALDRPRDLLDPALAEEQPPGVIADRVAAAVLPGAAVRQQLLETIDVGARLDQLSRALDELIAELRGEPE